MYPAVYMLAADAAVGVAEVRLRKYGNTDISMCITCMISAVGAVVDPGGPYMT